MQLLLLPPLPPFNKTQDRTILPIMLTVQRLCGVGSDAVFIGVMRPSTSGDPNTVRVWITMTGSVLCADDRFRWVKLLLLCV
jgi:hypothetical protein